MILAVRMVAICFCALACAPVVGAPARAETLEQRLLAERPDTLAADAMQDGDSLRGAMLFYHSSLTCVACHSDGGQSQSIGPDLTKVSRQASDATLVESVLQPSKIIAPGYETVTLQTTDGGVLQGLLVKETADELVLRDATQHDKLITVKLADIELRRKSDQSLMPVGQVNLLTDRQQALDLLRFLIEIRDGGVERARELKLAAQPRNSDFPPQPTAEQVVVERGEIGLNKETRFPRGIALGFVDGTALFDADQLRVVAVWSDGFVKTLDQNYFGYNWGCDSGAPEAIGAYPFLIKLPGADWQSPESPAAREPHDGSSFEGYEMGAHWARMKYHARIGDALVHVTEDVRIEERADGRLFSRAFRFVDLPPGASVALSLPEGTDYQHYGADGQKARSAADLRQAPLAKCRTEVGLEVARVHSDAGATWQAVNDSGKTLWRAVTPPCKSGEVIACQLDLWKSSAGDRALDAAALADLAAHPPVVTDAFDKNEADSQKPAPPPEWTPSEDRPTRPAVASTMNTDDFSPTVGRFLRFVVTSTLDSAAPGIDELEIYGADPNVNLALAGKATASSVIPGYPIHQIRHLNDGRHGNEHSWISHERGTGWARIELPEPVMMQRIVWGRDRSGKCRDRLAATYRIDISQDGKHWVTVGDERGRPAQPIDSQRKPLTGAPGYEIESIPLPFAGCRPSDIAFGPDGAFYLIAMTEGQIWRGKLPPVGEPTHIKWSRYASGLHHPIGLVVLDDRVYVAQKPEITELVDRDHDGVVDHYRTVATGWGLSHGWHEYCFGLTADRQKNLWFALNTGYFWTNPGYVNPGRWRGSVMRVSSETERLEVVAKGCRVPNGVSLGPDSEVFFTDNQGDWIQSCKLAHVVPGRFYGHPEYREDALPEGQYPDGQSAIWFPYEHMKSVSGPVYDSTQGVFGPFANQMFVGDVGYGANAGLMRVALENVDGEYQGACFRFTKGEPIGCERMKFGPDNQLYLASLTSGLQCVRFVGKQSPFAVEQVRIRPAGKGFVVRFTTPVAADAKVAPTDFRVERYHYLYTGKYGSPKADEQTLPVEAFEWSEDRQSLTLTLPVETYPIGMVYEVRLPNLSSETGDPLPDRNFWYTVNRIPQ